MRSTPSLWKLRISRYALYVAKIKDIRQVSTVLSCWPCQLIRPERNLSGPRTSSSVCVSLPSLVGGAWSPPPNPWLYNSDGWRNMTPLREVPCLYTWALDPLTHLLIWTSDDDFRKLFFLRLSKLAPRCGTDLVRLSQPYREAGAGGIRTLF